MNVAQLMENYVRFINVMKLARNVDIDYVSGFLISWHGIQFSQFIQNFSFHKFC